MLNNPTAYLTALVVGVSMHVFVFRIGEWDLASPKILTGAFASPLLATLGLLVFLPGYVENPWAALKAASSLTATSVCGIYLSMAVYRLAFHRLNHFPGPFMARLSNFYITYLAVKKFHTYKEVQKLHQVYGDVVRIGKHQIYCT